VGTDAATEMEARVEKKRVKRAVLRNCMMKLKCKGFEEIWWCRPAGNQRKRGREDE
jgi:hypothetical protein